MPNKRLGLRPRDELGMLGLMAAESPRQKTPHRRTDRRIDPRDPPHIPVMHQLDLARGDQSRGADVDQAVTQDIASQQHLSRATLKLRQVQLRGRRPRRAMLEAGDPVRGHEQLPSPDPRLDAGDRRQLIADVEPGDQILDAAQPLARRVKQRTADQRG